MKVQLKPGAELDLLTQGEVENAITAALSGFSRPAQVMRDFQTFQLNSSGASVGATGGVAGPARVFAVTQGYTLALHRLAIQIDGATYNPGSPYKGAGYVQILRSGRFVDAFNIATVGLPAVFTWGSDAPVFNNGEYIDIMLVGGPANAVVIADIQGTLETIAADLVLE